MDFRSFPAGISLILVTGAGSVLLGLSFSVPLTGVIGLVMIILPVGLFLWYLLDRINRLEERSLKRAQIIKSTIERSADRMNKKYDGTRNEVYEIITELRHRIYR